MPNLQVKNVPVELHTRLRQVAEDTGRTISELVLQAVEDEVRRNEFSARLRQRSEVTLPSPAADYIMEERERRTDELTGR